MEWVVFCSIACCIALFIYRECVVLYIARAKASGIMLESSTLHLIRHHTNRRIQRLDYWLLAAIAATLLLYIWWMVLRIHENPGIQELTVLEAGIALLLYIVFPSRNITHFITEKGLEESGKTTDWDRIHAIYISHEGAARRRLLVTFKGRAANVEGYMYDRDLSCLKQLAAAHPIMLREI